MNYTKGEWKIVHQDKPQQPFRVYTIIKGLEYDIADVYIAIPNFQNGTEANANLIAAAVNACQAVNPDNPMAVAEAIKDLYEACKEALNWFNQQILDRYEIDKSILNFDPQLSMLAKAIAKAERK